jgi:hypothetical protein
MADHPGQPTPPPPKALVVDPREVEQRPDQIDTISPGLTDESGVLAGTEQPASDPGGDGRLGAPELPGGAPPLGDRR